MTAVEGIGGMSLPILRGVFSNCVPGEKQGAVFSAIGSLEAALSFLSPLIFQNIYTHTVSEMPAATFYVIGGILVAAAFSTLPLIRPIHAVRLVPFSSRSSGGCCSFVEALRCRYHGKRAKCVLSLSFVFAFSFPRTIRVGWWDSCCGVAGHRGCTCRAAATH